MARSVAFRPRRRGVRSLPPVVRGADPFVRHALHGDLQRFGGLFRPGRRSPARRHAADARLRHLFRVPRRRRRRAFGGCGAGTALCHARHLQQRAVALRDRRPRGVHLDGSLPHLFRRAHKAVYQRFRRGAHRRERRPGAGRSLRRDRRCGGRVLRGPVLHDHRRAGRPRVDRGVRARAGRPGGFRRGARRGPAARQFRLRCQAADHAGASAAHDRGAGDFPGLDAGPRQEQGAAAGQRPPRGRGPAPIRFRESGRCKVTSHPDGSQINMNDNEETFHLSLLKIGNHVYRHCRQHRKR